VDAQDLRLAAVAAKLVILAHDERLDRPGRTHFRAQPAEAASGQIEIEIVEDLDLLPGLAMPAERDEIVGTHLRALIADDARRGAGLRLDLEPQHAAKARRHRTPLGRVLEREGRLRRVLERQPEALQQIDEKDRAEELSNRVQ